MGSKVAALSKVAITLVASKGAFASVTTSVSLEVAKLREGQVAARKVTVLKVLVERNQPWMFSLTYGLMPVCVLR